MTNFQSNVFDFGQAHVSMHPFAYPHAVQLTLGNPWVYENQIAAMNLNVTNLSVISEEGKEFYVNDFSGQKGVQVHSWSTGKFLAAKRSSNLPAGKYQSIRFYLESHESTVTHKDGISTKIGALEYLEFDILGGMDLKEERPVALTLKFDMPTVEFWSEVKKFSKLIVSPFQQGLKMTRNLAS